AFSPARQRRFGIATGVKLLFPMQSQVDEIGRYILAQRPFPRCVRYDQGGAIMPQQLDKGGIDEAVVANFNGVTQRSRPVDVELAAAVEALVVSCRQLACSGRV